MIGRIFLVFPSLILYSSVYSLMKKANLHSKYTVEELLQQLKNLRQIESISGKKYITEITKKQREIYDGFKISLP